MEKLYAEFLLLFHGFNSGERYEALLNEYFLNSTNDDVLLELEEYSSNLRDTSVRFMRYWTYECPVLNADIFGKSLFDGLRSAYNSNLFSIEEFSTRCYSLWRYLPDKLTQTEPFWTFCYAGDCLSWGDEKQTREFYEKAFKFYD